MWSNLSDKLEKRTTRLISEHESYAKWVHAENSRRMRRSTRHVEKVPLKIPESWSKSPGFNPYIVKSRSSSITHAVTKALKNGYYAPHPPFTFLVPKANGERSSGKHFSNH